MLLRMSVAKPDQVSAIDKIFARVTGVIDCDLRSGTKPRRQDVPEIPQALGIMVPGHHEHLHRCNLSHPLDRRNHQRAPLYEAFLPPIRLILRSACGGGSG